MYTREQILDEIRRVTAELNRSPGRRRFEQETGIGVNDWLGRYWAKWGDALAEAGFAANVMQPKLDDALLAEAVITLIRELGHFPTNAEAQLRQQADPVFPGAVVKARRKSDLARIVLEHCRSQPAAFADVIAVVEPVVSSGFTPANEAPVPRAEPIVGHVYLLRLGKHYKIGRTNAFGRRERELEIQMPERAVTVHVINTDDPVGIEAYWHRRFAEKRVRSDAEWFALSAEDVRAFKRRKFQ